MRLKRGPNIFTAAVTLFVNGVYRKCNTDSIQNIYGEMGKGRTLSVFISLRKKLDKPANPLCRLVRAFVLAAPSLYTSTFTAASLVAFSDSYKGYGYGKTADTFCSAETSSRHFE